MTDEQVIEQMAKAMAEAVRDKEWAHYVKPARAAFWVAKEHLVPAVEVELSGATT